ncbi:MAG: JAB domain-containing protein [Kiritimatiellia bacterium]
MKPNELFVCVESATQAAAIIRAALPKEQKEERVFVLPLDANGKVLAKPILVAVGHEDGTAAIDPGTIFREALKAGAEEIIVAHSHPSGDPTPSKADIAATRELKDLASRLGVVFLDHLVIGSKKGDGFVSLAEVGV